MLAGQGHLVAVCRLWTPDLGAGGNDFSGYAHGFEVVVSRHVVGDHPKERGQCLGPATRVGPETVSDGLDLAAQIAQCHGPAWTGSTDGKGGGRRMLPGRTRGGSARPFGGEESPDCGRSRGWARHRAHPFEADPRCLRRESTPVRAGVRPTRQRRAYRWLERFPAWTSKATSTR